MIAFTNGPYDAEFVSRLQRFPPHTPIPDELRREHVIVSRRDLPNDSEWKLHVIRGYRIEDCQRGFDTYDIEWWAAMPAAEWRPQ